MVGLIKINKLHILFYFIFIGLFALVKANTTPIIYYGVLQIKNKQINNDFTQRLNATGSPLFLIKDLKHGIKLGDMIRFKDKIVLIDEEIWQTMKTTGVLEHLKHLPLVNLKAKAKSQIWKYRNKLTKNSDEKKGYLIGGELLKVFEDYFGKIPNDMEFILNFDKKYMTLIAPKKLLENLTFTRVKKKKKTGKPKIVSIPPKKAYVGQEFSWTIWAVDPSEPESKLSYSLLSTLPKGLTWDSNTHSIIGVPSKICSFDIKLGVINSSQRSDFIKFNLKIKKNQPPEIAESQILKSVSGSLFSFKPVISDPDNYLSELKISTSKLPSNMVFENNTFKWLPSSSYEGKTVSFELYAEDPFGAKDKQIFKLKILSPYLALESIDFPLDTLIQGHKYQWKDSLFLGANLNLLAVKGDNFTNYNKQKKLTIIPENAGKHLVDFTFLFDTLKVSYKKNIVVKKNQSPIFKSKLSSNIFSENQIVFYTPVILDKENDSLKFKIINVLGNIEMWDGESFLLPTTQAGEFSFEFIVEDQVGNIARQRIIYKVLPKKIKQDKVKKKSITISNFNETNWNLTLQYGIIRFGAFVADLEKTLDNTDLYKSVESPFVFIGANLFGEEEAKKGNTLYFDTGLTLRSRGDRILAGGLLLRFEGKETYTKQATTFEYGLQLYAKQAIVIVDSTEMDNGVMNDNQDNIDQIFADYGGLENTDFKIYAENWFKLPNGFSTGQLSWFHFKLDRNDFTQYLGLGLRHEAKVWYFSYFQNFRIGWATRQGGPEYSWNIAFSFGN